MGYEQENWKTLGFDLRTQHLSQEVIPVQKSDYGEKYEVLAPLIGPNGKMRWLRSVGMIRKGKSIARFITLIPEEKP
jgi:hypothetical protein